MKNVLLVGSSFSAVPLLFNLKKRGMEVTVIGKHGSDPCHAYSDHSIYEDYSNSDALLKVVKDGNFDYIVPSCNDYAYLACASVAQQTGLPGFDNEKTTEILHFKNSFRDFCLEIDIPTPRIYGEVTSQNMKLDNTIQGPVLIKPVDSFSGRGMQLVENIETIQSSIQFAFSMSRQKRAIIEEYVSGTLHSHTALISDGKIIWYDFVDEFCEQYSYQVDRSSYPTILTDKIKQDVQKSMEKIVSNLKMADGLLHTQFIASTEKHWIIETMRRCPGDLYGHQFKFSFHFDYEHEYISSFVGEKPQRPNAITPVGKVERRVLSSAIDLPFCGVAIEPEKRNMIFIPLKESGQLLKAAPFDKIGIIFFNENNIYSIKKQKELSSYIIDYDI